VPHRILIRSFIASSTLMTITSRASDARILFAIDREALGAP
jgi:hypothetical protein